MLVNLYIENYVLFDKQNLSFNKGFSALTGDTGAGKSLIIDALNFLTGQRLNVSINKNNDKSAFLEGVFQFKNKSTIKQLIEAGFKEESEYIVSREVFYEGRSISRINGRAVTLGFVKDIFEHELDIHSQRDNQYLLNKKTHLTLLDKYSKHDNLINDYKKAYDEYDEIKKEIFRLKETVFNEDEIDFIQKQIEEIDKVNVSEEELNKLNKRLSEINNFESIFKNLKTTNDLLSNNQGVVELLYEANDSIQMLDSYVEYNDIINRVQSNYHDVVDIAHEVASMLSNLEFDEFELNNIEKRLYEINHLLKKYGNSIEIMLERKEKMQTKVDLAISKETVLSKLNKELKIKEKIMLEKAKLLRKSRLKNIKSLKKEVVANLVDLDLVSAQFDVKLEDKEASKSGIDDVEFLVAMNKGTMLQPLAKVASGGELSRLMLGLKVIFSRLFGISTVIFDEIDAGVSGSIATSIGLKMSELAKSSQVFSVTHLAQVAACSDQHYYVKKDSEDDLVKTEVIALSDSDKIEKLAIMSTGMKSDASLKAAKELYNKSQKLVNNLEQ